MTNIKDLTRPAISKIEAYHVEPFPARVVLDANESPYPLPDKLKEQLFLLMAGTSFNRYPDPQASMIRKIVATHENVDEKGLLFGNGSDDLIAFIIATFCDPGESILIPTPTFSMYKQIATTFSVETVEVPLLDNWNINLASFLEQIAETQPKIIFLATPNNPTGTHYSKETIESIIDAAPGLLVIDEAYVDYAPFSLVQKIKENKKVVVLKTLSKIGFAALRLGYLMAHPAVVAQVEKVRLPFNVNSLTQAMGYEVIKNFDQIAERFATLIAERERVFRALTQLDGIKAYPSAANFILLRIERDSEKAFIRLLSYGVRVRWFENHPRLSSCFRVTIGTAEENNFFLDALSKTVAPSHG